jgi:hypothetical protein
MFNIYLNAGDKGGYGKSGEACPPGSSGMNKPGNSDMSNSDMSNSEMSKPSGSAMNKDWELNQADQAGSYGQGGSGTTSGVGGGSAGVGGIPGGIGGTIGGIGAGTGMTQAGQGGSFAEGNAAGAAVGAGVGPSTGMQGEGLPQDNQYMNDESATGGPPNRKDQNQGK